MNKGWLGQREWKFKNVSKNISGCWKKNLAELICSQCSNHSTYSFGYSMVKMEENSKFAFFNSIWRMKHLKNEYGLKWTHRKFSALLRDFFFSGLSLIFVFQIGFLNHIGTWKGKKFMAKLTPSPLPIFLILSCLDPIFANLSALG